MKILHAGLVSLFGLMPGSMAFAQQVPAIQSNASASASASASAPMLANQVPATSSTAVPPAGEPPLTVTIKPPAVNLDKKEKTAATLSANWRNKRDTPHLDSEGVLRWIYGVSQPRIVCSPSHTCDIELKPGETLNNAISGDTSFWHTVCCAVSGGPDGRVTHVYTTPLEAGHETSLTIYTDERTYDIKLVSDEKKYVGKTGFIYPKTQADMQESIASYRTAMGASTSRKGGATTSLSNSQSGDIAHIEILTISGDSPSWKPLNAYTDGRKTYIQFPHEMQFGDSPSLLGVNSDGGFFSSPTERRVIYRWMGDRLIADTVMDRLKLVLGVGSNQTSVFLTRRGK